MIRPYSGEYLVQPFALHLGLNWCSHNCYYCFANLDQPERRGDWKQVINMMDRAESGAIGKSLTAKWLQEKRPILVSNVSDPFAKSNDKAFQEIFQHATKLGHTFAFQTRGGAFAQDTLAASKKTSVYISVTSDKESHIKEKESGAPSFVSRMELIKKAKDLGHSVVVGINPYVPEWWDDIEGFVNWLKQTAINRVWTGTIHISNLQVRQMPSSKQVAFASEISYMRKKVLPDQDKINDLSRLLKSNGINEFYGPLSEGGGFWQDAHETMTGTFKTLECVFDELKKKSDENGGKPVAFNEAWFTKFIGSDSGLQSSEWADFVTKSQKNILNESGASRADIKTASSYHKMLFALSGTSGALTSDRLNKAVNGKRDVVDKNGFSILVWMPAPSKAATFDINETILMR